MIQLTGMQQPDSIASGTNRATETLKKRQYIGWGILALLLLTLLLGPETFLQSDYRLSMARQAFYMAGLAATWSLLAGIAGQFSFAHVAIAGLAGYSGAIWGKMLHTTYPFLGSVGVSIVFGILFALVIGTLLGVLLLRLRAAYLALFTIAFSEICRMIIVAESDITGGRMSLSVINLSGSRVLHYYIILATLLVVLAVVYWLLSSRFGLFLRAMREDDEAAASLGLNVVWLKIFVFSLTSGLVGLIASFYFHTTPRLVPENLDFLFMALVIAYAVIGALEIPLAGAISAMAMVFVLEYLRRVRLGPTATGIMGVFILLVAAWTLFKVIRVWRDTGWSPVALLSTSNRGKERKIPEAVRRTFPSLLTGGLTLLLGIWLLLVGSIDFQPGIWRFAAFGLLLIFTVRFYRNGLLMPVFEYFGGLEEKRRETVAHREAGIEDRATETAAENPDGPTSSGIVEIGTSELPSNISRPEEHAAKNTESSVLDSPPGIHTAEMSPIPDSSAVVSEPGTIDLRVENLHMRFGGNHVLQGVNFTLDQAVICGLIGPNGSGKTTLTNVLNGVYDPSGGAIYLRGERVEGLPPYQIARRGLGRTFQISRAFRRMTVLENLLIPGLAVDRGATRSMVEEKAYEALRFLTIEHLANEYARALSGGQKKLLELARLLILDPDIMILDEPFAGVHPRLKETIYGFIQGLRSKGKAFIIIEHDMEAIFNISERLLVLANGTLIADDEPSLVRHNPQVIEAYLGKEEEDAHE